MVYVIQVAHRDVSTSLSCGYDKVKAALAKALLRFVYCNKGSVTEIENDIDF